MSKPNHVLANWLTHNVADLLDDSEFKRKLIGLIYNTVHTTSSTTTTTTT